MRSGCARPVPGINIRPHRQKVRSFGEEGLYVVVVAIRAYQVACSGTDQSYNVSSPRFRAVKNTQSTVAIPVLQFSPEAW